MMLRSLDCFDTLTMAMLKTMDLSAPGLEDLAGVVHTLRLVALGSHSLVTPEHRRKLMTDGQAALDRLTDTQKKLLLEQQISRSSLPTIPESADLEALIARVLSEDAASDEFAPELWEARSAYFAATASESCSGCGKRDALSKLRAAVLEYLRKGY